MPDAPGLWTIAAQCVNVEGLGDSPRYSVHMWIRSCVRSVLPIIAVTTVLTTSLLAPAPVIACGNNGTDTEARAEQAISWARSLVEWHSRRRVVTADPADVGIVALQGEAEIELTSAIEQFDSGMFEGALDHARTVEALLDN